MIKTTITPHHNTLLLPIPDSYVGKEIEVFLYAKEELIASSQPKKTNNAARFKGLLTNEEAEKYHKYLKHARSEWDRDI